MDWLGNSATAAITVFGVIALLAVCVGAYWLVNKQARLRQIAELRKRLDELLPADPEYGAVRALYTSMVIDAHRSGFFHSDAGSGHDGGGAQHGGDGHVGDHSSGGGHNH